MKLLKLWRTFKEGFANFYRNGWLSVATTLVLAISLYIVGITMIGIIANDALLEGFQDRVNISIYFKSDVEEDRIIEIKDELEKYLEIKSVTYFSKEEALGEYNELTKDDPTAAQVLEEIGENPFLASLIITANRSEQYEIIDKAIRNSSFWEEVNSSNFERNKSIIEAVTRDVESSQRLRIFMGAVFIFLAILITFNTIRITIYSHRQEFEIMRLVGASNIYVRMPFVFEGIFYGIAASIIAIITLIPTSWYFLSLTQESITFKVSDIEGFNINFLLIYLVLLVSGVVMGVFSSFIAIRRYLNK